MDPLTFVTVIAACIAVSLVAGLWAGAARARLGLASQLAELESLRAGTATLLQEREVARAEGSAARQAEAALTASLRAAEENQATLRSERDLERQRAEAETAVRTRLERELASARTELAEREQNLAEQRRLLQQAEEALKDAFKAAGADVMKEAVDGLIRQAREQFEQQQKLGEAELDKRRQAVDATLQPLREQLAKQEQLVRELAEKREGDTKALAEQLKQISQLQLDASKAAQTLSSALRDNRQRGRWGEVSLRNLAEMAGLVEQVDFIEQAPVDGEEGRLRPDMVVRLPGDRRLPVDAKVPMAAYLDSLNPDLDDRRRSQLRADHARALRAHVRTLASRGYARELGGDADLTVLFVPLESGLIAALEEDMEIYNFALDQNIVIATASTLLAFLRTCALQWQQAALSENARRIGQETVELLDRIGTFAEHLENTGIGLRDAALHYNKAVGSFNARLLPKARATAQLLGTMQFTDDLELVDTDIRSLQA